MKEYKLLSFVEKNLELLGAPHYKKTQNLKEDFKPLNPT